MRVPLDSHLLSTTLSCFIKQPLKSLFIYFIIALVDIYVNISQKCFIQNLGKKFIKLGISFYKKCLKIIKNTRKRAFSGEKYPTQWDDEAKNSEKTKVF